MSAIITRDLRIHNAKQFVEGISEPANTKMYMFIGKSDAWGDENAPDTPYDSITNQGDIWDNMIALKRIQTPDIVHAIPKYTWSSGNVYDTYDSTLDGANLFAESFVVMNNSFNVYKCLRNNYNGASTVQPTGTGEAANNIITSSDGYIWKYMYTIDTANALTFITSNFIPIVPSACVSYLSANARGIYNYKITKANIGEGLAGLVPDNTVIVIAGDGSGANANVRVSQGNIISVGMINAGKNYTVANVVTNLGNAIIEPMVPPLKGHGYDAIAELGGFYVMVNNKLEQTDTDFPVEGVKFRQIGIVKEPYIYGTNTLATADTLRAYSSFRILGSVSNPGALVAGATITGGTSKANATIINATANVINFVQTRRSSPNIIANYRSFQTSEALSVGGLNIGTIDAIEPPTVQTSEGEILYIDHRKVIPRAVDQVESLYIVLEF